MKSFLKMWPTSVATILLLAACQNKKPACQCNDFPPDDCPNRAPRAVANIQSDIGAAADATLYPRHFDGNALNSLGREKLHRIQCAGRAMAAVWIDLPESDSLAKSRRDLVEKYLKDNGVPSARIQITMGPNPNATPAAFGMVRMEKTESGTAAGSATPSASGMTGSAGSSSGASLAK